MVPLAEVKLRAISGHSLLHRICLLSGVKRTWLFALHMSAFDPKRTSALLASLTEAFQLNWNWRDLRASRGCLHAPARFHESYCWFSGRLAARGPLAATGYADRRLSQHSVAAGFGIYRGRFPQRPERSRLQ